MAFQEALQIYPPCGRRKICLKNQNKMYGRNELIARYIKLKTGKSRTRKQVSSHIQVLGRRKSRENQAKLRITGGVVGSAGPVVGGMMSMSDSKEEMLLPTSSIVLGGRGGAAAAAHHNFGLGPFQKKPLPPPNLNALLGGSGGGGAACAGGVPFGGGSAAPLRGPCFPHNSHDGLEDVKPFAGLPPPFHPPATPEVDPPHTGSSWEGRAISTPRLSLVEFSAFVEYAQTDVGSYQQHLFVHIGENTVNSDPPLEAVDVKQIYDKFPDKKGLRDLFDKGPQNAFFLVKFWADLNYSMDEKAKYFYGVTSRYESNEEMELTCSTKLCSFGKQVVEKVETECGRLENGRFVFNIHRSPMCEYMINFIHKLKHLPAKYNKNSVLENFTILQVITNRKTEETLLCNAYVFEVSTSEYGAQHHIYRLVKE